MPIDPKPLDQAGGLLVIRYSQGPDTHKMNLHVRSFGHGGGGATAYDPPPLGTAAGGEASVEATFTAFANVFKNLVGTDGVISLDSVWTNPNPALQGPLPLKQVFPTPNVASVTGINANPRLASGIDRATQNILTGRTINGGRFRWIITGQPGLSPGPSIAVNPSAGGNTIAQTANYFMQATSGICGHDGFQVTGPFRLHLALNRRLRKKYGLA